MVGVAQDMSSDTYACCHAGKTCQRHWKACLIEVTLNGMLPCHSLGNWGYSYNVSSHTHAPCDACTTCQRNWEHVLNISDF